MKVLSVQQIREADAFTIINEPIASIDLMERAAENCFCWILDNTPESLPLHIFCGTGNNGGDGICIGRKLLEKKRTVHVYLVDGKKYSDDNAEQVQRFFKAGGNLQVLANTTSFPAIEDDAVVIDALLGTGLTKPTDGVTAQLILHINRQASRVISIDCPSGLFTEDNSQNTKDTIIKANTTLSLEMPKLAFLFPENHDFIGNMVIIPIGLHPTYLDAVVPVAAMIDAKLAGSLLHPRSKFSHKGSFGHTLLIAGSLGKIGASILAGQAVLRSGAGLLTIHSPACGYTAIQSALPEAMVSVDDSSDYITSLPKQSHSSIGIGPGIGQHPDTANMLLGLLESAEAPLVLDADALNIIAHNGWLGKIPANSILTPHPGEFERLAGKLDGDYKTLEKQQELSQMHEVFIVRKGANSCITTPDGRTFFNTSGNPGMATAGSGDVLTGILTGLLSQGYSPLDACLLAVFLHGLAGDFAAEVHGQQSLIASDIVAHLGDAYHYLQFI